MAVKFGALCVLLLLEIFVDLLIIVGTTSSLMIVNSEPVPISRATFSEICLTKLKERLSVTWLQRINRPNTALPLTVTKMQNASMALLWPIPPGLLTNFCHHYALTWHLLQSVQQQQLLETFQRFYNTIYVYIMFLQEN